MSYVVINAITVPPERRETIEERFANRAGEVSKAEGFERFEFLRPASDQAGDEYFVYTRWASKEAFQKWASSSAFTRGHAGQSEGPPAGTGSRLLAYDLVQEEGTA